MVSARPHEQDRFWQLLLLVLVALTLYRAWVLVHNALPLFFDEAQYWAWSRTPDWGYYSKPPMVAWLIALTTLASDSELAIRIGTLLLHPLTALLVYATGRRIFGAGVALAAALLFISLPLVGFNSLFMTTDAPLFFFWGLAVFSFWRALEGNAWRHWLLAGVALGMGLLSKYSMLIFVPSAGLALCLPAYRAHWRNPRLYVAGLLALLIFLPNLWWNAQMDFVSFRHTAEISQLERTLFHPARLFEFIGAQFLCMGPVAFALLLAALAAPATWRDRHTGFLAALTLPFLAVIALQALLAKANANWAAPAYFGGALLVAARWSLHTRRRRLLALVAIGLNLLFLSGFYHYRELAAAAAIPLTRSTDPYARLRGWPQIGEAVRRTLAQHPDAQLAVLTRDEFALLSYYARPESARMRIWNPAQSRSNHFHLVADAGKAPGATYLFASRKELDDVPAASFASWRALGQASVPLYPGQALTVYLYLGQHFKGYQR